MKEPKLSKARLRVLSNIEAGRPWNHGGGNGMGGAARRMLEDMRCDGLVDGEWPGQITTAGRAALAAANKEPTR